MWLPYTPADLCFPDEAADCDILDEIRFDSWRLLGNIYTEQDVMGTIRPK